MPEQIVSIWGRIQKLPVFDNIPGVWYLNKDLQQQKYAYHFIFKGVTVEKTLF